MKNEADLVYRSFGRIIANIKRIREDKEFKERIIKNALSCLVRQKNLNKSGKIV